MLQFGLQCSSWIQPRYSVSPVVTGYEGSLVEEKRMISLSFTENSRDMHSIGATETNKDFQTLHEQANEMVLSL